MFRGPNMSRIPVPTNSYSRTSNRGSPSPIPFPERANTPPNRPPLSASSMSTLSGSMAETRKKQTKRDEVRVLRTLSPTIPNPPTYTCPNPAYNPCSMHMSIYAGKCLSKIVPRRSLLCSRASNSPHAFNCYIFTWSSLGLIICRLSEKRLSPNFPVNAQSLPPCAKLAQDVKESRLPKRVQSLLSSPVPL